MSFFFLQICNRVTTLVDVRILSKHGLQSWLHALDQLKKIFNLLENYLKIPACSQVSDRCPLGYLSKKSLVICNQFVYVSCLYLAQISGELLQDIGPLVLYISHIRHRKITFLMISQIIQFVESLYFVKS